MVDDRHQDVLDDVEQDVGRKKGTYRDIKTISELQNFGAS